MPAWWAPKDLDRTGGPAIDLHIHDADFVQFLFGMPGAVTSAGVIRRGGVVEHIDTHYHFEGGPQVTASGGWLVPAGLSLRARLRRVLRAGDPQVQQLVG